MSREVFIPYKPQGKTLVVIEQAIGRSSTNTWLIGCG